MKLNATFQGKQPAMEEAPCEVSKVICLTDKEYAFFKKHLMVGYEEEKLLALRMYAEQRGVSVEEELAQAAEAMYQKIVPANVRAFVDMKVESQKPKRKGKDASASAVGD